VNLKGLDEGPQQSADAFTTTEQLDKSHDTEQTEEVDADDRRAARLQHQQQPASHSIRITHATCSLLSACSAV